MKTKKCKQNTQKQPSIDVLRKRCSENCTKFKENTYAEVWLLYNFIEIAPRHGCSRVNLLYIFRTLFPKKTYGGLLLEIERLFHDDSKDINRQRNIVRKLTICKMNQGIYNPFVPNAPFLYPLKALENFTAFWYFQGLEKGCIGNEWVNPLFTTTRYLRETSNMLLFSMNIQWSHCKNTKNSFLGVAVVI